MGKAPAQHQPHNLIEELLYRFFDVAGAYMAAAP
jgi:hypothetical protein